MWRSEGGTFPESTSIQEKFNLTHTHTGCPFISYIKAHLWQRLLEGLHSQKQRRCCGPVVVPKRSQPRDIRKASLEGRICFLSQEGLWKVLELQMGPSRAPILFPTPKPSLLCPTLPGGKNEAGKPGTFQTHRNLRQCLTSKGMFHISSCCSLPLREKSLSTTHSSTCTSSPLTQTTKLLRSRCENTPLPSSA